MKKLSNIKTYTILQNGNKHLSKSKNSFFTKNVTSSPVKDDVITSIYN